MGVANEEHEPPPPQAKVDARWTGRRVLLKVMFITFILAAAIAANRLATWTHGTLSGTPAKKHVVAQPSIDLGVVTQKEKLRLSVDFRPLLQQSLSGALSVHAPRGECQFMLQTSGNNSLDGEPETLASFSLDTTQISQVYYDRFEYRLTIPVEVRAGGSIAGAGLLKMTVRKPLVTQYPSIHFGSTCIRNVPANSRSMEIRTAENIVRLEAISRDDVVSSVVRQLGPNHFALTVTPQTDRPAGSYRSVLKLNAETTDGRTEYGADLPVGFVLNDSK